MLERVQSVARIVAGVIAVGYLAWTDIRLALAVVFAADLVSWAGRRLSR